MLSIILPNIYYIIINIINIRELLLYAYYEYYYDYHYSLLSLLLLGVVVSNIVLLVVHLCTITNLRPFFILRIVRPRIFESKL